MLRARGVTVLTLAEWLQVSPSIAGDLLKGDRTFTMTYVRRLPLKVLRELGTAS